MFFEVSPCTLLLPNPPSGKRHPSPFSLTKKGIHMDNHLKEELTVLFWKLLGIPYPHRQSANDYITTLCQWLILTSCEEMVYMINICCLLIFILCKEKIEAWFVFLVSREYHGVEPITLLSTNQQKNYPLFKWTTEHVFSKVQLFQWIGLQLQCPCANGLRLQRCSQRSCFRFSRYFPFWRLTVFCIQFWVVMQISLLAICTHIRKLSKKISASSSKDVKELCWDSQPSYMPSKLLPLKVL